MTKTSNAKMFLADERGCNETDLFRSYNTFNFGTFFNEFKLPFDSLYVLNDETLAGRHSFKTVIEQSSYVLLLPVVGSLLYEINQTKKCLINPGQIQVLYLAAGETLALINDYENSLVNFLQIRIKAGIEEQIYKSELFSFNLENKNILTDVTRTANVNLKNFGVSIGKFCGRAEAFYPLKKQQNKLFVFVLEGVFEVNGRLLHPRDSLALWNEHDSIEFEALSNDAIILFIELNISV